MRPVVIGQWEGQDVPLVRPSSCTVKGGIPSSRRYLPTYLRPVVSQRCGEVDEGGVRRGASRVGASEGGDEWGVGVGGV